jgi:hypothetical protein
MCGINVLRTFLVAAGDDNMTYLPPGTDVQAFAAALPAAMKLLGFISEPIVRDPPSFCSAFFVPMYVDGVRTEVLVPDIRRPLAKSGFSQTPTRPTKAFIEKAASLNSMPVLDCLPVARQVVKGMLYAMVRINDHSVYPDFKIDDSCVSISPEATPDYKIAHDHTKRYAPIPQETDAAYLSVLGLEPVEANRLGDFLEWVYSRYGGTVAMAQSPHLNNLSQVWCGPPTGQTLPVPPLPKAPHLRGLQ